MKAIILAGGRGKRLRPITDKIPKPLIPINNKPLIERTIKYLKKYGITEIIISSGYKSDLIEKFLKKKKNFGCEISFSIEKTPLGTGGAVKKALRFVDEESFVVLNGDIVTNIDLKKILKKPNTIAANELKTKFGTMDIRNNKILKFNEKKDVTDVWMNPGIYHLSMNIEKIIPRKGSLEGIVFPKMAKNKTLETIKFKNALWFSIDSHKDIEECSKEIKSKKYSKYFK
ncbi:nucleoside-diphosphate-sugar pyrophosphorylase [Candidatus Nitrosopelagicus brevis]|uniref:MobA-like NTP transferase domain protein n=1 Tax=Candidatus Nitrosopelagicus brevis TaxID=1410606 RepID=A0A0A7UZJ9_9ARCH|nr:nucleotidyltransferase family protein [Candidatus Nitrosopelagicus brevis]AJA92209.1 MobA-like NTP transferase domain protein [Candidatus Nitrosopelagicus brevis]PTL87990.1 nucleoside-diphosphate-sugar pyrophosphorylase [Candidatus Nitrosopelagicus brevis]